MLRLLLLRLGAAFLLTLAGMTLLEQFNPHPPQLVVDAHRIGMVPEEIIG
jgi:hypothetical protein